MFESDRLFDIFDYQQLANDFCYQKPFELSFRSKTSLSSIKFDQLLQVKSKKFSIQESLQIQTQWVQGRKVNFWTANNFIKIKYWHTLPKNLPQQHQNETNSDNQEQKTNQQNDSYKTTIFGAGFADRKFQNASVQLGVSKQNQHNNLTASLTAFLYQHKTDYFLYTKAIHTSNKFRIGFISIFDIACRNLQTNDIVISLKPHPQHCIFLRGQVDGLRNYSLNYRYLRSYFDHLSANYIFSPTQSLRLMSEVKYDLNTMNLKYVESVIQQKLPDKKIKLKLNTNWDLAAQFQFPLAVGNQSTIDFGLKLGDILASRKISYGFRVNLDL